jgi:hypothetical protein
MFGSNNCVNEKRVYWKNEQKMDGKTNKNENYQPDSA